MPRHRAFTAALVAGVCSLYAAVAAQTGATGGEWRTWGGDLASTHYAPLSQINKDNFNKLEIAWRFKTDAFGPRPEYNFQSTPLMVGGIVYSTAGSRRAVVALDARTGELIWMHSENEGKRGDAAPRQLSGRGLAYWSDGRNDARIVYVTPGYRMLALDAKTGVPVAGFGRNGVVDLKLDDDQEMDLIGGEIGLHAAPVIARDTIIVGAAHLTGAAPKSRRNEKGYVRGFDVRTGKRMWIFHTIPENGEFGADTWEGDSRSYTGNAGVWAQMSVDEELGLVYLPVELPTGDYFGGHRHGNGLFGESLVAVDLKTGKRRWHFQFVHHGLWDMDIPCAPVLADLTVNGRPVKAALQPTKQGWIYAFNRETGEPIWPIEERPVEQSTVPMEKTSPTQPFVTRPAPFDRQGVTLDDLIDYTPELKAEAVRLVSKYKLGPIFTPPVVSTWDGPMGTLMLPSTNGGANWPGASFDPVTKMLYIHSATVVSVLSLLPPPIERSDMAYVRDIARDPSLPPPPAASAQAPVLAAAGAEPSGPVLTVQGLPLIKPPYSRITAYDMNKGDLIWQIPHGETPDTVTNHPALKGVQIPRTGRPGRIGMLVTPTLLIAGEGGVFTDSNGIRGSRLRAYDKATGKELGAVFLPAGQTGSPMTYMLNGKQYILVAVSGGTYSGELLAFSLPD
jgi:quinoprotein glucose dehydrogenase